MLHRTVSVLLIGLIPMSVMAAGPSKADLLKAIRKEAMRMMMGKAESSVAKTIVDRTLESKEANLILDIALSCKGVKAVKPQCIVTILFESDPGNKETDEVAEAREQRWGNACNEFVEATGPIWLKQLDAINKEAAELEKQRASIAALDGRLNEVHETAALSQSELDDLDLQAEDLREQMKPLAKAKKEAESSINKARVKLKADLKEFNEKALVARAYQHSLETWPKYFKIRENGEVFDADLGPLAKQAAEHFRKTHELLPSFRYDEGPEVWARIVQRNHSVITNYKKAKKVFDDRATNIEKTVKQNAAKFQKPIDELVKQQKQIASQQEAKRMSIGVSQVMVRLLESKQRSFAEHENRLKADVASLSSFRTLLLNCYSGNLIQPTATAAEWNSKIKNSSLSDRNWPDIESLRPTDILRPNEGPTVGQGSIGK